MKTLLEQAEENKRTGYTGTCKVKERPKSEGKILYSEKDGKSSMSVVNSPRGYNKDQLQGYADKLQKLQKEGRLPSNGSIAVSTLEKL